MHIGARDARCKSHARANFCDAQLDNTCRSAACTAATKAGAIPPSIGRVGSVEGAKWVCDAATSATVSGPKLSRAKAAAAVARSGPAISVSIAISSAA